jgi:hypothetical protein
MRINYEYIDQVVTAYEKRLETEKIFNADVVRVLVNIIKDLNNKEVEKQIYNDEQQIIDFD